VKLRNWWELNADPATYERRPDATPEKENHPFGTVHRVLVPDR
jgi:hypothetical protein